MEKFEQLGRPHQKPKTVQVIYPKFLTKYSLLASQMNDFMFKETFVYQVMIFADCLKSPIKD